MLISNRHSANHDQEMAMFAHDNTILPTCMGRCGLMKNTLRETISLTGLLKKKRSLSMLRILVVDLFLVDIMRRN